MTESSSPQRFRGPFYRDPCFRTAIMQGIVCGTLIGLHRYRNPSGRLLPISLDALIRPRAVSLRPPSPSAAGLNATVLGFLSTASFSFFICRSEETTRRGQIDTLRTLERKAAEMQENRRLKDGRVDEQGPGDVT